jgi:hypothetical protein
MAVNADVLVEANNLIYDNSQVLGTPSVSARAITQYNSTPIPTYFGVYSSTPADSQFKGQACQLNASLCFPTQNAKGQFYQNQAGYAWNIVGADGYGFVVGLDYWQYTDNFSESGAYGLVSLNDNLYDGVESCGKSIKDPWGFTTAPEPTTGCYGDFITPVKAANRIWLGP